MRTTTGTRDRWTTRVATTRELITLVVKGRVGYSVFIVADPDMAEDVIAFARILLPTFALSG